MKEDETIDAFTTKLTTLVNKATSLGHTIEDKELVRKLLNAVPDRYLQIFASIRTISDLDEMKLPRKKQWLTLRLMKKRLKFKKGKQVDIRIKLNVHTNIGIKENIKEEEDEENQISQGRTLRILRMRGRRKLS
ncbi:hypothetical protein Tco_1501605 [Tanacetum coccineum]